MPKYTRIIRKAEALGWHCSVDKNHIEFYHDSPAGEDFGFDAYGDTCKEMSENINDYADCFDEEDHVMMLMVAKRNGFAGVPSMKELVEDATAIHKMLNNLAQEVA